MDFIKTRDEDETANLIWNDSAVQHEKIAELRNYQVGRTATLSSQHTLVVSTVVYKLKKRDYDHKGAILNPWTGGENLDLTSEPIKLLSCQK